MIAAMSRQQVELIQYVYKGGYTSAVFSDYLEVLIDVCRKRYRGKMITVICDNLRSHKCTDVMKVVQDDDVEMVFLPSYSTEFSAIESLFGCLKNRLKDMVFSTKENLANLITNMSKDIGIENIESFYKLTFNEMITFLYNNQIRIKELLQEE